MFGYVLRLALEIRFLRKHATYSIAPQVRKQSFACHFAALVFMDYPRVSAVPTPAIIQCSAPPAHGPEEVIANPEFRMITVWQILWLALGESDLEVRFLFAIHSLLFLLSKFSFAMWTLFSIV